MNNSTKIIVALVAVVIIAVGAVLVFDRQSDNDGISTGNTNTNTTNSSDDSELSDDQIAATITYTEDGFSPASVTVPAGSAVRIVNQSSEEVGPSSDPHPDHNINPELNFPDIQPGQSATMVVTEPGTWGYHNHFNEDQSGTIIVQ